MYREYRDEQNNLTSYIRSFDNASIPVSNENPDYRDVKKWIAAGNTPGPDPGILDKVKASKISEYKAEATRRIGLQVPEWDGYEQVKFVASIWNMLGTPNAAQAKAKAIYLYVKNTAIPNVNARTDVASVQTIDVANDPGWPI